MDEKKSGEESTTKKRKKRTTPQQMWGKRKIIKENERLVGCERLASLFFFLGVDLYFLVDNAYWKV